MIMRKCVLFLALVVGDGARFNDRPDMRSQTNTHGVQIWPSAELLTYVERGHRMGDFRLASSQKRSSHKSSTNTVTFDVKTAGHCSNCEYTFGSSTSNSCLTSAGSGLSRCSSFEDKLGFTLTPYKTRGGREYVQIMNTIDGVCIQDTPTKLVSSRSISRGLNALLPKILKTEQPGSSIVQQLINMIWKEKSLEDVLNPIFGACLKSSSSLFAYQLWHIEALQYSNKGYLLRNTRTNRCLQISDNSIFTADCTDPDALSSDEGTSQLNQIINISPRAPAISFRQSSGASRCLQMVSGSPLLVECATAVNTKSAVGSSGGLFDFRPAGGCVDTLVLNEKLEYETQTLCAFSVILYSPSAPVGSDKMCLTVERQIGANGQTSHKLETEKCAIAQTSFDPSATPLSRRGSFADAEKARGQVWWIERVDDTSSTVVGASEKVIMRWRFYDGMDVCLTHSTSDILPVLCHEITSSDSTRDPKWFVDPFFVSVS